MPRLGSKKRFFITAWKTTCLNFEFSLCAFCMSRGADLRTPRPSSTLYEPLGVVKWNIIYCWLTYPYWPLHRSNLALVGATEQRPDLLVSFDRRRATASSSRFHKTNFPWRAYNPQTAHDSTWRLSPWHTFPEHHARIHLNESMLREPACRLWLLTAFLSVLIIELLLEWLVKRIVKHVYINRLSKILIINCNKLFEKFKL